MKRIFIPFVAILLSLFFTPQLFAQQGQMSEAAKKKIKESNNYLQQLAQNPNVGARSGGPRADEQDCINAIPVCQNSYSQSTSYSGIGNVNDLSPNGTCLSTGETNSVWYVFTAQTSGSFTFMINTSFDYDFALWNITNSGCSNLGSIDPIRCNYSASNGNTGLITPVTPSGTGPLSFPAWAPRTMPGITIQAGETYALLINNYTGDNTGYTITFDGDASIVDNTSPTIAGIANDCNYGTVTVTMDEPVNCNALANATATITGSVGVTVTGINGVGCANGSFTREIEVSYTQSTPTDGQFTLTLEDVEDNCGNIMASDNIDFNILTLPIPVADPPLVCLGSGASVDLSVDIGPGVTATWSNGQQGAQTTVTPNTTTTYSVTTSNGTCDRTTNITVPVIPQPVLDIFPANPFMCGQAPVTLTANLSVIGADYLWSTGDSTQSITVTPSTTTDYWVRATIGGCDVTDTVTVVSGGPSPEPVCINIYVTPTGNGVGTKADPTDIRTALGMAQCNNSVIKMATGFYVIDSTIDNLTSYTTIEGGFEVVNNWRKTSLPGATTIFRSANNPDGPPQAPRLAAFYVNGQSFFRLQDLTIEVDAAPAATGPGVSTYGLHFSNCTNYDIVRCQIIAGDASEGAVGQSGADGSNGSAGGNASGQNGGTGACGVSGCGGNGGNGGDGGSFFSNGDDGTPGAPGDAGIGGTQAAGGSAGEGDNVCADGFIGVEEGTAPTRGENGADGADGADGPDGSPGGFAGGFFEPGSQAFSGDDGDHGLAGGGGGGAGGASLSTDGGGGGGGGAGGEGGSGGAGGYGGGASFGVFLFNNGPNTNFLQTNIQAGSEGTGGIGGVGGTGGNGGARGLGTTSGCDSTPNGDGGEGGDGGDGGQGGDGQPGISGNLYVFSGDFPATADSTFGLQAQATINVQDISCANTDITFSGPAAASWDFGIGATNTTASNAIEINQYDTIGRKNITYDSDYYAGFTNIAVTAADVMPDISTSAQFFNGNYRVCAGDSVDFFSSKSGIDYIWTLGGGATPNVRQGDSLMTLRDVVFETPDTFWITLQVESDCCGLSDRDSLLLVVDSLPGAFIQPDTLTTLCQGQSVTLTAGGGTTYEWNTGQVTQSISVTPPVGMNPYVVEVTSDLGCKNYSDTTFVEVNPGPAIEIVGDNTVCPGDSTVLSVSGFPGSNITWWNKNGDTIVSNTITVTTDSLIEYFARAENLSCYSNIDSITVFADELPEAVIVGDSIGCLGDSITVMATGSKDYVWNNGDSSAVQTFFVTGDTTVSVIPISATGCVGDEVFFDINAVQFREVEVSLSADPNPVCPDDEVTFTADPTFGGTAPEYAWVINGDTVEVNSDSVYTYYGSEEGDLVHVVLFSNEACITGNPAASNEIEIEHFELPEVALQELDSSYIIYDDPVPLVGAPEGGEYAGDGVENNAFNPELLEVGGPYFVTYTYTDSNGCANSDTVQTFIEEVDELYGLPNAFSPNSGGVNGTFSIVNSGAVSLKQAQIFNRWGELVHNKTSPWDGTYNGKLQPAGTYVYYFVIVLPDGEEVQETGNFSLIR